MVVSPMCRVLVFQEISIFCVLCFTGVSAFYTTGHFHSMLDLPGEVFHFPSFSITYSN